MTKASIPMPSLEVSRHVFRQPVILLIGQLFPIYVHVIVFYNGFYDITINMIQQPLTV